MSTIIDIGGVNDVDDTDAYFFDSSLSLSDLSIPSTSINYHDCPCIDDDSSLFTDWMNLDTFNDNSCLDCSKDFLSSTLPSTANFPTPLALNTLVRGCIPWSFDDTIALGDLFSIIVDSGASLSISPHKYDFIGPIPKVRERR